MGWEQEQDYERLKHENPEEYKRREELRKAREAAIKKAKNKDRERDER